MRLLTVIHSVYCSNPRCKASVWYSVMEPENPERQFKPVDYPSTVRCCWCRTVSGVPGYEMDGSSDPEPWQTFKTPNEAVGVRDRK